MQEEDMGAETEFSVVVLVLSLAHLTADVTQWALEPPPPPPVTAAALSEPTPVRHLPDEQEPGRPGSAGAALAPAPDDQRMPVARRSPSGDREPFERLPLDFSIDQPPWCVPCQRSSPRVGDSSVIKIMR
jgi:hypothetical protein